MVTKDHRFDRAFSSPSVPTCRSENRRVSSQQQANEVLPHDLPKFHLKDYDISAGLSFLLMGFHVLEQPLRRQQRQRR